MIHVKDIKYMILNHFQNGDECNVVIKWVNILENQIMIDLYSPSVELRPTVTHKPQN